LGNKEAIRGRRNLDPKKVARRTKIIHKKLITETSLDKVNIFKVITNDDRIINIQK
jgi:hypothetical protein